MSMYTVHLPPEPASGEPVCVREGFNWFAFYLAPLWCAFRRSWLGLFLWIAGAAMVFGFGYYQAIAEWAQAAAFTALNFLFGLEASVLRRRSLERRGYAFSGLVSAASAREAELAFALQQGFRADSQASAPAPVAQPGLHTARPRPVSPSDGYGIAPLGSNP